VRVVLQRVERACVAVDGSVVGEIGAGLLLLIGVASGDDGATARRLADKIVELRIFADDAGRFDRSLIDSGGAAVVVSQFTLLANVRRGRRPGFTDAASPDLAERIIEVFCDALRARGVAVATGRFGAKMSVSLVNDGPVTIVVDSADLDQPRRR
jgi:D-tyrosyl-tRNA(Tyr) deacylase